MDPRNLHRRLTIGLSALLAILGLALIVVGSVQGAPPKLVLGIVVVCGGVARIAIERRRGRRDGLPDNSER